MMYHDKLAVAIKNNGKVLREAKDTVYLPFGCEYTIMIKNLNSVRALVRVTIDGQDAMTGTRGMIINANETLELERFIKDGNLHSGNRFKFIEKTQGISDFRGDKIDDGLIRIEFEFEREAPKIIPTPLYYSDPWTRRIGSYPDIWCSTSGISDTLTSTYGAATADSSPLNVTASVNNIAQAQNATSGGAIPQNGALRSRHSQGLHKKGPYTGDGSEVTKKKTSMPREEVAGITVAGSESNQSFSWGHFGLTDGQVHAMILRVVGEVEGEVVQKPVTVDHKPQCTTCGRINKANSKFCTECGTALKKI